MNFIEWLLEIFATDRDVRYYNNGMKFMEQEEFSKASYEFTEALKIKPTVEKYHDAFGKSLYKRGMTIEADTAFGIADDLSLIKTEPKNLKAICRLAMAFQNKRMFPLSQQYIQKGIAINPDNDQVHFLLGRANYLGNNFSGAIEEYNKAIVLNPYCVEAYKGLRDVYSAQGRSAMQKEFDELAKYVKQVADSPDDADLHAELGDVFQKYHNEKHAVTEYFEALKLNGKCKKALLGIGILKYKRGHHFDAKKQFLQVIKIEKFNAIAHSYLGLIYQTDKRTLEAAKWELALAKQLNAMEKKKDKFKAYVEFGDFLFEGEKLDDAEEVYLWAMKENSKNPELHVKLGLLYSMTDKAREAIDYCEQAIKLAPEEDIGYIGKGRVLLKIENFDQAITLFQEALNYSPKNPKIHKYLAVAYKEKGLDKLADKEMRIMGSLESKEQETI